MKRALYFNFNPNTEDDCKCIDEYPHDAKTEEGEARYSGEQKDQQDGKC